MSELIQQKNNRVTTKWQLLASVSVLALIANATSQAKAEDPDHPTVWIEAGAQLERLTDGQEPFAPPFVANLLQNPFTPPAVVQKPPLYAFGEEGRLSLTPDGSDWVFSASLRYGRANSSGSSHEETSPPSAKLIQHFPAYNFYRTILLPAQAQRFATTSARNHSSYLVFDFQAGKDVGLGGFGRNGASTLNAGVRVAQFTSQSKARIDSDPNFAEGYRTISGLGPYQSAYIKIPKPTWDLYEGKSTTLRSFHGIGPSVAWDADAILIGNPDARSVTLDWGLNGALLFGRQKVSAHSETMDHYQTGNHFSGALPARYPTKIHDTARSRSVVVPNVGGFAGFSLRFPNAKLSVGYRADFFFGAMDGGIDTRKSYDRNFYGPFATISIGLGGASE